MSDHLRGQPRNTRRALMVAGILLALPASAALAWQSASETQSAPVAAAPADPLASACRADVMQSVAAAITSSKVEVKPIRNGPRLADGTRFVAAAGGVPAYCQITGSFVTNPATGKTANFLANLPANWNGKYLQLGCGGHCGILAVSDAASPIISISAQGRPGQILQKGYASFGTDQGHEGTGGGAWAVNADGTVNQDAIDDLLYRANMVLADMGKEFARQFYSRLSGKWRKVERSYFAGCSAGGRDALVAASRFPEQFDGILAGSPASNSVRVSFHGAAGALAPLRSADADLPPSLVALIDPIVKAQCDRLDGMADGLIQNPAACNFRPERDLPRCDGKLPAGKCFTKGQIDTVSMMLTAVTDETGAVVQPGLSPSDFQFAYGRSPRPADINAIEPWPGGDSFGGPGDGLWAAANAAFKIFVHRNDPAFHTRQMISFAESEAGPIRGLHAVVPQVEVARAMTALRAGIGDFPEGQDAFIRRGGKLLIWHNLSDQLLTPYMSYNQYKRLAARHGGYERLKRNVRLFTLPGTAHCSMSGVGPGNFDALTALENWVEKRKTPDALVADLYPARGPMLDFSKPPSRSMPLCAFPAMARYKGSGDINAAASWTCPAGDNSMLIVGESGRRAGVIE